MKFVAIAAAVVFLVIAILYWTGVSPLGHHVKHGAVALVLSLLSLAWLRFAGTAAAGSS